MRGRKELFYSLLDDFFSKEGFKYLKSRNAFVKKDKNENQYAIRYTGWPMFLQVETKLDITIKEVDDIKKKAWGKKYFKFVSVGTSKAYLVPDFEGTLWTETERNVRKAVKKEIKFYKKIGAEYFRNFSNITFLDEYLNAEPGKHLHTAYNPTATITLALIVAKLNNNPNLKKLCDVYREVSNTYKFEEYYEPLVEYLIG